MDEGLSGASVEVVIADDGALERAFDECGGAVWTLAVRLTGSDDDAGRVVRETFLEFWADPMAFDPDVVSLRSFLLTVAHRRATGIAHSSAALVPEWDTAIGNGHSDFGDLTPPEQRAIRLALRNGSSYTDVGEVLDVPSDVAKRLLQDGMRKLAAGLDGTPS